jgi:plasmid stabilization system protein ParE
LIPQYSVTRSEAAREDLEQIFNHLLDAQLDFGESIEDACHSAQQRIQGVELAMARPGTAPHQGTRRDDLMHGLRQVTKARAIFYFTVDEALGNVNVLAIFFGGRDHQRHLLKRLLGGT